MFQDSITTENKYNIFIRNVAASKLVWGLKDKKGWANSTSNDDEGEEETTVIPFWSDRAYAKACARDDWRDYSPTSIPLAEFLENWCVGMTHENVLVGVNWDANMFGKESDAVSLAVELLDKLSEMNSAISFSEHDSIEDLKATLEELTDEAE